MNLIIFHAYILAWFFRLMTEVQQCIYVYLALEGLSVLSAHGSFETDYEILCTFSQVL